MKIAICVADRSVDCGEVVRKMAAAQCLSPLHASETFPLPGGAVAVITTSDRWSRVRMIRTAESGNLLALTGVPIDLNGSLDARLDRAVEADFPEAAQSLRELDGAFAALMWDARHRKLVVVTDFLGVQPLFMVRRDGLLLLASDLKALPASGLVNVEMDPAAWGAFLTFGHGVGDHTQLAGVRRVEPACTLVYDPADDTLKTCTYWQWPEERPEVTLDTLDTEQLVDVLRREVRAYGQHTTRGTVLLSGGFDSRLLLSLVHDAGLEAPALALTHKDELWDTDGRLASAVARRLGIPHRVVTPPRTFFGSREFVEYLVMSEVACPSLYLFISQVRAYLGPEMNGVWEGVAPGMVLHPYPVPPSFGPFLEKNGCDPNSLPWKAARRIFGTQRTEEMHAALSMLLSEETAKYPDAVSGIYQFKTANYMRNRLAQVPLKVYANDVLPLTPGFSRTFWDMAASIPPAVRVKARTYYKIFRNHFPQAGEIPFLSGDMLFCNGSRGPNRWFASLPYHLSRSQPVRLMQRTRRRLLGGESTYWVESRLPEYALQAIDVDHPDLNADGVRHLQQQVPPYDIEAISARRLAFHWQAWRWIMEGRLSMENAAAFANGCMPHEPA